MQDNRPTDRREEVDFRKLLEAAIANPQAVYALFDLPVVKERLNIIGRFSTDNVADAEELPLAVLFKVLENIARFEPDFDADEYGRFLRWVGVIARNLICDNLRRKKFKFDPQRPEDFKTLVDPGISPELAAERDERDRRFRAFIANLESERDRKILEYALAELSLREVADKVSAEGIPCSHTTVKNVIDRMRQFLANEDLYFLPRKRDKPSPRGGDPEDKPAGKRTEAK